MDVFRLRWDMIKENIRTEYDITNIAFNIWVKPLEYVSCENNTVTILIPDGNPDMLAYIEKNYTTLFQAALSDLFRQDFIVRFILEEELLENVKVPQINDESTVNVISNHLNKRYRFENFVVGPNNTLAHSAGLNVAESPGKDTNNPLFIYGDSGLGKTHLMSAIGNYIDEHTDLRVLYVTSEEYTNEVIKSILTGNNNSMELLREKYRNVDVLLIDDIQFIIGKKSTQEEFFHTFNTLYENGKEIILTSDKHPVHMKELDERFRSRFKRGLTVDIQPPDYETRVAILRKYAEKNSYEIPDEIIFYIAENIRSNIRELEGAYNKVYIGRTRDLETAKKLLRDTIISDKPDIITPPMILKEVSAYYNVDPEDITSSKRNAEFVLPRQIFMYLCREMTDYTFKGVAALLGKKDHSTIIHGYNRVKNESEQNTELRETIEAIKNMIKKY